MPSCAMRKALTVTEESQVMHLQLVVNQFVEAGKRLRPSARPRMRVSADQFDRLCDFACVYAAALQEGRQLSTFKEETEADVKKSFMQRCLIVALVFSLFCFGSSIV